MASMIDKRISRDMKYIALYCSLYFFEYTSEQYIKYYDNDTDIIIYSDMQKVEIMYNSKSLFTFELVKHESFVLLELINRLLLDGIDVRELIIDSSKNTVIYDQYTFNCHAWEATLDTFATLSNETSIYIVRYKSRLKSGIIDFENIIEFHGEFYDKGLFEFESNFFSPSLIVSKESYMENGLLIQNNKVLSYSGNHKTVIIPEGITELEICLFWDNQTIEEVVLPDSLVSIGGDTFYNCRNLKRLEIPENVRIIGDNPFGGCSSIEVINSSKHLVTKDAALLSEDQKTMIYYPIQSKIKEYSIPSTVEVLGKHCFYMCENLEIINIPSSVKLIKNNPFSGCKNLELVNCLSKNYQMDSKILYNKNKTTIKGVLESLDIEVLVLPNSLESIGRNSFWNCKKIGKVILPNSLNDIGYNPFIGCENISFESNTEHYKVLNNVLYNSDFSKLICHPKKYSKNRIDLIETVRVLERGAFSGHDRLNAINLMNVNSIGKSCFSNCINLIKIYCPDWVTFIGECAFAHTNNMQEISFHEDTFIDMNAFINTPAKIIRRNEFSNYLVESNNIFTLETMQERYSGIIDCVYIDPPYNTAITYINYQDDWEGTTYFDFMDKRLKLACNLLSKDGSLIIHIDINELSNLVSICSKYFSRENISVHKWKKKNKYFDKNRVVLNPNKKKTVYEYIIVCRKDGVTFNDLSQPYLQNGKLLEKAGSFPEIFDFFGTTSSAKDEINLLFGDRKAFSTPKPIKLVQEIIRATTNSKSIILDFFAGSGTVGEATMKLNNEANSERKFIIVTNSENNICKDITLKRTLESSTKYDQDVICLVGDSFNG